MYGYYYKAGKSWEDKRLWEVTKDNPQEDISVESFLKQDNYWNIGSFTELAKEMKLVLDADYTYPIILDEEYKLVDGAHRLVHAYIDGKTHIKGVIIRNDQWPEPDYDEMKECQNTWKPSDEQMLAINTAINVLGKGTLNGKQLIELQEQLKKLIELGIDINTADMYYDVNSYGIQSKPEVAVGKVWSKDIPAWSLTALLGLIPDKISINNESYYLSFTKRSVEFRGPITWDGQKAKSFEMDNIIDAAFKMVCWLKENKKL